MNEQEKQSRSFQELKNRQKRHATIKVGNKEYKAHVYLKFRAEQLRRVTKDPFNPKLQLFNPLTGAEFNHERDLKAAFNRSGAEGINEYTQEVNKALHAIQEAYNLAYNKHMAKLKQRTILHDLFGDSEYVQPINQKQKGNNNERETAKYLSVWLGVEFVRTPSSGGRRLANNSMFVGDVVCGDESFTFPCVVETKHYESIILKPNKEGMLGSKNKVFAWWKQAFDDANRVSKMPLLFCRENGMPKATWFVFMPSNVAKALSLTILIEGVAESGLQIACVDSKNLLEIDAQKFVEVVNTNYLCGNENE